MALYYPLASAANKPTKRRSFFSYYSSVLFWLVRFVGIVASGVAVLNFPELGERYVDAGWLLILAFAPLSAIVEYWTPREHRLVSQTLFDLSALVLFSALLPPIWVGALVCGAVIIGSSVPRIAPRQRIAFVLLPTLFVGAMGVIASFTQAIEAWAPLVALSVATPFCLLYALREQHDEKGLRDRENLMDSLTHMAGGIGHDFNNLLTGIQGNAELAEQKLDRNHVARPYLQALLGESQKAQLFSAQLLAFSGGVATGRERLDVRAELLGLVGLLESALPRGVQLGVEAEANLPLVSANRAQLQEIAVGGILYVADAVKVVPSRVTVSLRRVTRRHHEELVVQIRVDTSFDGSHEEGELPVNRENLASLRFDLARAQAVARDHEGHVAVHGNSREGRVITLRLPILADTRSAPTRTMAPARSVPRHLILLERTPEIHSVVSGLLSELGHRVTSASGEEDMLNLIQRDPDIDGVMLDTPGSLSRMLLTRIDDVRPGLPALLSESARDRAGEWADRPNVNYIAKPFSSAGLNSAIKSLFDALKN